MFTELLIAHRREPLLQVSVNVTISVANVSYSHSWLDETSSHILV